MPPCPPNAFVEIKSIKLEINFSFHPSKLKSGLWLVDSLLGQLIRSLVYKTLMPPSFLHQNLWIVALHFKLTNHFSHVYMIRQKIVVYPEMIGKSNFVYYWLPIFSKKNFTLRKLKLEDFLMDSDRFSIFAQISWWWARILPYINRNNKVQILY